MSHSEARLFSAADENHITATVPSPPFVMVHKTVQIVVEDDDEEEEEGADVKDDDSPCKSNGVEPTMSQKRRRKQQALDQEQESNSPQPPPSPSQHSGEEVFSGNNSDDAFYRSEKNALAQTFQLGDAIVDLNCNRQVMPIELTDSYSLHMPLKYFNVFGRFPLDEQVQLAKCNNCNLVVLESTFEDHLFLCLQSKINADDNWSLPPQQQQQQIFADCNNADNVDHTPPSTPKQQRKRGRKKKTVSNDIGTSPPSKRGRHPKQQQSSLLNNKQEQLELSNRETSEQNKVPPPLSQQQYIFKGPAPLVTKRSQQTRKAPHLSLLSSAVITPASTVVSQETPSIAQGSSSSVKREPRKRKKSTVVKKTRANKNVSVTIPTAEKSCNNQSQAPTTPPQPVPTGSPTTPKNSSSNFGSLVGDHQTQSTSSTPNKKLHNNKAGTPSSPVPNPFSPSSAAALTLSPTNHPPFQSPNGKQTALLRNYQQQIRLANRPFISPLQGSHPFSPSSPSTVPNYGFAATPLLHTGYTQPHHLLQQHARPAATYYMLNGSNGINQPPMVMIPTRGNSSHHHTAAMIKPNNAAVILTHPHSVPGAPTAGQQAVPVRSRGPMRNNDSVPPPPMFPAYTATTPAGYIVSPSSLPMNIVNFKRNHNMMGVQLQSPHGQQSMVTRPQQATVVPAVRSTTPDSVAESAPPPLPKQ